MKVLIMIIVIKVQYTNDDFKGGILAHYTQSRPINIPTNKYKMCSVITKIKELYSFVMFKNTKPFKSLNRFNRICTVYLHIIFYYFVFIILS